MIIVLFILCVNIFNVCIIWIVCFIFKLFNGLFSKIYLVFCVIVIVMYVCWCCLLDNDLILWFLIFCSCNKFSVLLIILWSFFVKWFLE